MKFIHKSVIMATAIAMASCATSQKVPYIQDSETIPAEVLAQIAQPSDAILAAGDLLNIDVTSTNMEAVIPFNKGMYMSPNGTISKVATSNMVNNGTTGYEKSTDYYLIDPEGNIDFPVVGSIHAAGLSKAEFAARLTDAIYPKYIKEKPKVDVRLMNFRVVVTGAVKNPGIYDSNNERMNFFEAIAKAGDLDIKGDRENILLYRTNADGTREVHKLDINDKNFLLSPYFTLQQNDIIYVAPNKYMSQNAWQMNPAVSATITYIGGISSLASLVIGIINLTKN